MGIQSTAEETMNRLFCLFSTLCLISSNAVPQDRAERAFPIFSIVKFANDDCLAAGTVGMTDERRGTCYTAEECTNRDGTAGAPCAEGFGICCQFTLTGTTGHFKTVSQNNTRIEQDSTTDDGMVTYTICPCGSDVCRIRFDFVTLTLANQVTATAVNPVTAAEVATANAIGSCLTDTFMISGISAGGGSPVICGSNNGHHMVLDSDGKSCHTINIMRGMNGGAREWTILARQYACGDLDNSRAGPPGCLQYHTARTGRISDYGSDALAAAPAAVPALAATATHLANQDYKICIRRFAEQSRICYEEAAAGNAFGLSTSANAIISQSQVEGACTTDFVTIPGAQAMIDTGTDNAVIRLCGQALNNIQAMTAVKVCSRSTPFMVGVNFDAGEVVAAGIDAMTAEIFSDGTAVTGKIGFRLSYEQDAA